MKKCLVLLFVAFSTLSFAHTFGNPKLIKCPHCGTEKAVINLMSGNTIGSHQWWDLYRDCPMLPQNSAIQHCSHCGHYFVLRKAEHRESEEYRRDVSTGELTFSEASEAWEQLKDSLETDDKISLALIYIYRYNDYQREWPEDFKHEKRAVRSADDLRTAKEVVDFLTHNFEVENPLIYAEWLCNVGEFEKAKEILEANNEQTEEVYVELRNNLVSSIAKKDSCVKLIY